MVKYSVIITSYKEPDLIPKAIESIILSNLSIINQTELLVVCGDKLTYKSALDTFKKNNFTNYQLLKDDARGKSQALNIAFNKAKGDIWIMTDGDMYLSHDAIVSIVAPFKDKTVSGVTGNIRSLENKTLFFGYYSHVFTQAANYYRSMQQQKMRFFPLSGYLYAIRKQENLILPDGLRAEDAYLSHLLYKDSCKFVLLNEAVAYVNFPKNFNDLIMQKTRSLGGNVQNKKYFKDNSRNIMQDLAMFLFPLTFAKNLRELVYSVFIYPIRLYLWVIIYYRHMTNNYKLGIWDRIDSSKY
ncbi:MAG: glycosyltransferase [bacterium]|nr:glycosyltransferase [bacterium]